MTSLAMLVVPLCGIAGCGDAVLPPAPPSAATPDLSKTKLTAEIWKQMQDEEKYSVDMLKRLRSDDPALRSPAAWKKFHKEVVAPGFERDILNKNPGTAQPQPN